MDETSFLDHMVAHARVGSSIELLSSPSGQKQRFALAQLNEDLKKGSSYVEEAVRLGVTDVLTKLMTKLMKSHSAADEAMLDDISHILSLCSGPMACAGRVITCQYDGLTVQIREGPLGDGLGARVWAIAHVLCRELVGTPSSVQGLDVLEIGAGTGICGIVAAKLGARRVVLSDNEPLVLGNLRTCMHLNASSSSGGGGGSGSGSGSVGGSVGERGRNSDGVASAGHQGSSSKDHTRASPAAADMKAAAAPAAGAAAAVADDSGVTGSSFHGVTDEELFDDAESVKDFDFSAMVVGGADAGGADSKESRDLRDLKIAASKKEWEAANMEVRLLDWVCSLEALDGPGAAGAPLADLTADGEDGSLPVDISQVVANAGEAAAEGSGAGAPGAAAPQLPEGEKFPLILANETMYEPEHAVLVAAVIAHRLARGGRALMCSAVRFKEVFEKFGECCASRRLRYRKLRVQPNAEDFSGGMLRDDYEGGFLCMAVDWAVQPSEMWHRDDFE